MDSPRAVPPCDISPAEFFERWIPNAVAADAERRERIAEVDASIQFELSGEGGGSYYLRFADGAVQGFPGKVDEPDLILDLSIETWRQLNAGELNAVQAAARRALRFKGSMFLALKVHFLLK